jgi:molybdopterin synthase sulfur carrier subunit
MKPKPMQVEVRVFATLRRYQPDLKVGEALIMQVEPGTTLDQLRVRLGLPQEEVAVIMRNNRQANPEDEVNANDRIAFIPAVAGG